MPALEKDTSYEDDSFDESINRDLGLLDEESNEYMSSVRDSKASLGFGRNSRDHPLKGSIMGADKFSQVKAQESIKAKKRYSEFD